MTTTGSHEFEEVTTGGAPIVRTDVRPQADHSPPPVVTSFTCAQGLRCQTYQSIKVSPSTGGVHQVTFHGKLIGVYAPFNAALVIGGLHAGAHLEASEWRWSDQREEP